MTRREWIRRISRLDRKRPLVKRASILGIHSLSLPPFVCITLGKSSYGPTVEGGPVMLARHHRHSVLTMMNDVQNVGPSFLLFIFSSVFFFLSPGRVSCKRRPEASRMEASYWPPCNCNPVEIRELTTANRCNCPVSPNVKVSPVRVRTSTTITTRTTNTTGRPTTSKRIYPFSSLPTTKISGKL